MSVFYPPFKPLCKKKRGGCICIQSGSPLKPPFALRLSVLCTLKKKKKSEEKEAGVSQLNIYTFLAFILLHT